MQAIAFAITLILISAGAKARKNFLFDWFANHRLTSPPLHLESEHQSLLNFRNARIDLMCSTSLCDDNPCIHESLLLHNPRTYRWNTSVFTKLQKGLNCYVT